MPFVPVPKDLAKVKTKVAFNLTKRQIVCFGGGGLVGVPAYIFTRGSIGNEPAALLMIGLMLPFFLFGMHLLLREEQTAAYTVEIWKRFRKWGGIPTGITQNVKDLLASREIANIFENSDFIYMLNQAGGDRQILAKQLNISPHQLGYVTNSNAGEGLLFYGNVIIP